MLREVADKMLKQTYLERLFRERGLVDESPNKTTERLRRGNKVMVVDLDDFHYGYIGYILGAFDSSSVEIPNNGLVSLRVGSSIYWVRVIDKNKTNHYRFFTDEQIEKVYCYVNRVLDSKRGEDE